MERDTNVRVETCLARNSAERATMVHARGSHAAYRGGGRSVQSFVPAGVCNGSAGELLGLHVEDINFKRGVVTVRRSTFRNEETSPKSANGYRTIFLDKGTLLILKDHLDGRTAGRIFSTRVGSPLKCGEVCRYVPDPLCKRLGILRGGMHAFRHGRVSQMFATGVPEAVILREVGHSSLKVTNIYSHFDDEKRASTPKQMLSLSQVSQNPQKQRIKLFEMSLIQWVPARPGGE
jgi:integrase